MATVGYFEKNCNAKWAETCVFSGLRRGINRRGEGREEERERERKRERERERERERVLI